MAGLDENTKLLLHCNGIDESTAFPDASDSDHNVTANGTAQIDTAIKKWGTGSGLFDGDSDYLSILDSLAWDVWDGNDSTVDFWVKLNSNGDQYFFNQVEDGANRWAMYQDSSNCISFYMYGDGGNNEWVTSADPQDLTTMSHLAACRSGNDIGIYLNGAQIAYLNSIYTDIFSAPLEIGRYATGVRYLNGRMDEIRIQKSNDFSASPNAELTDTITVPTGAYGDEPIIIEITEDIKLKERITALLDPTPVSTFARIHVLNAPEGTIETADKFQFLFGLNFFGDSPASNVLKRWRKILAKFIIGHKIGNKTLYDRINAKWYRIIKS